MAEDAGSPDQSGSRPIAKAESEKVIEAVPVEDSPRSTTGLTIGIQIPPTSAAQLASSHPEKLLDLVRQVDDHQYDIAKKSYEAEHEQLLKKQDVDLTKFREKLSGDREDRKEARKYGVVFALIGAVLFLAILGFAGWTGDKEIAKSVVEKLAIFAGGLGGGYGIRLTQDRRTPR